MAAMVKGFEVLAQSEESCEDAAQGALLEVERWLERSDASRTAPSEEETA